ncbi:hypothetical protein M3Y96_00609700 [Aphelenchoides besseyi]|nr:hypothetical protein M3Y96_00609700 [Aphelenchoides besseyi]
MIKSLARTTPLPPLPTRPSHIHNDVQNFFVYMGEWKWCTGQAEINNAAEKLKMVDYMSHFACYFVLNADQPQPMGSMQRGVYYRKQNNNDKRLNVLIHTVCEQLYTGDLPFIYITGCHCVVLDEGHRSPISCCCLPLAFENIMKKMTERFEEIEFDEYSDDY